MRRGEAKAGDIVDIDKQKDEFVRIKQKCFVSMGKAQERFEPDQY